MSEPATTFDLYSPALKKGTARVFTLELYLPPISLAGQDYRFQPEKVRARLSVTQLDQGYAVTISFHCRLMGACWRCLEKAELEVEVEASEFFQPELPPIEAMGEEEEASLWYLEDGIINLSGWARDAVVEVLPRILPVEDEEISAFAHKAFEKQGIKIMTGATVKSLKKGADQVTATVEAAGKTSELTIARVISAVGIVGNVEDIGLEGTAIKVEKTHVVTDPWMATGEPGVYAIGDLTGPPWLAHKASHEGVICVEKIAGVEGVHPLDVSAIPGCTYCMPQIASVGLTERAAREKGFEIRVGRFPLVGNGKAIALGEPEGMVKTVFDAKTGALLGAHMIGAEVTEMIQGYCVAKTLETTEAELIEAIFPHPTISETMHESVLDAYGRAIHI